MSTQGHRWEWGVGGRLLGSAGRDCSLAESKGALGVKLLQSTFPIAYHVPDLSREHLRTALINIKTKDTPKEGRSVNVGTSKRPRPGPGPWVPFGRGRRKTNMVVAERDCFSIKYFSKALDSRDGVRGKISEAMEGTYSKNKDAQLHLPPGLLHLPKVHMNEKVEWNGVAGASRQVSLKWSQVF